MSIAASIKSFHDTISAQLSEAEERAVEANFDTDYETAEFVFADGSVLIFNNNESRAYGSK